MQRKYACFSHAHKEFCQLSNKFISLSKGLTSDNTKKSKFKIPVHLKNMTQFIKTEVKNNNEYNY